MKRVFLSLFFLYQEGNYLVAIWELLTHNVLPLAVQVVPILTKATAYKPYEVMVIRDTVLMLRRIL